MKKTAAIDPGLVLIQNYERAIVDARLASLHGVAGVTDDEVERARVDVEAVARLVGDALRAAYAARSLAP